MMHAANSDEISAMGVSTENPMSQANDSDLNDRFRQRWAEQQGRQAGELTGASPGLRAYQQEIMRVEYASTVGQQLAEGQPRAWESFPETD